MTDPAVLAALGEELAAGLDQQAVAAQTGTAMGGVPYPHHFYRKCATAFRAMAAHMKHRPVKAVEPTIPAGSPPVNPASDGGDGVATPKYLPGQPGSGDKRK
jgi:hypothetical protein